MGLCEMVSSVFVSAGPPVEFTDGSHSCCDSDWHDTAQFIDDCNRRPKTFVSKGLRKERQGRMDARMDALMPELWRP